VSKIYLREHLVRYTIRRALNLPVDDIDLASIVGSSLLPVMRKVVAYVACRLVFEKNNHLRCGLCGRGPFTKRGLYLHLTRVHTNEILRLIDEKYNKYAEKPG